ncbi:isochorismate synthase [Iamia sp. SCSIO 61187]|uniref:isochorismate synthase n=1 Tax=Iamia sp. SCSIO 61187 TaxID=2722752 RepID=UPI001C63A27C|nr:isochorismate synthase [Iamia sp. SCSIO 61187]QYG93372.1 isochorismate synthase [Iamia sp. SCSIO 61187]
MATPASGGSRLVAITRPLDRDVDVAAVAGAGGLLFARADGTSLGGRGEAVRLPLADAAAALAAADVDDPVARPGSGPVAVGALPFRPGAPADLVVPATAVVRSADGTTWLTTVGTEAAPPPDPATIDLDALVALAPPPPGPGRFDVASARPPADWCAAVADATARIRDGQLEKVVLAREIVVTADAAIDVAAVVRRLRLGFPGCYVYLVDGFVGASPELLVAREGSEVRSQPMAGTAPRRGDPVADADAVARLQASTSYRHEHQVTIDAVYDALVPFCSYLDFEAEPSVVALPNVTHLATTVAGQLSSPPPSVLDLVAALHPTPAVCGRPREAALAVIDELEGFDRGPYAGAVGWTDRHGHGEWAVAIRSAVIDGTTARVFGGNGIVGDSDPPTELTETRAKLQAILGVLVRP